MTATLTHLKTVRFDPITYLKIIKAAGDLGITTSDYIREVVTTSVALVDIEGYS